MLNTREMAVLIWGLLLFGAVVVKKDVRVACYGVITSVLRVLYHPIGVIASGYIGAVLLLLYVSQILDLDLVKDYVIWVFFGLLPLISRAISGTKSILQLIAGTLQFSIIPLFVINEYTLPLWSELLLVPVIVLVSGAIAVSGSKSEDDQVKRLLNSVLGLLGAAITCYAFWSFVINAADVRHTIFWKKMFLEIPGAILHVPLLYLGQVYSLYEQLIVRTRFTTRREKALAALCIFKHLQFSLSPLVAARRTIATNRVRTLVELDRALSELGDQLRQSV